MSQGRSRLKDLLGESKFAAELDYKLRRQGKPVGGFHMRKLDAALPGWVQEVKTSPYLDNPGKQVFIFCTLHYWVEHAALLGLALRGLGHQVTLAFLPYANWDKKVDAFTLTQQNAYGRRVLAQAEPLLKVLPLLDSTADIEMPAELADKVARTNVLDVQYTQQTEEVELDTPLYHLRQKRNAQAARATLDYLQDNRPDVVIVPNGLILEFGAVFETARSLEIPVVSYEFGEQRQRLWLDRNVPVMYQDTSQMWQALREQPFDQGQFELIKELVAARQDATLWNNFARRWQDQPVEGEQAIRNKLRLDQRPLVVLAANVIGDSLTLDRQGFSGSMTRWIKRTLAFFNQRPDVQFVIRAHPGELGMKGPSVQDTVAEVMSKPPENIHIIAPDAPVNTYDLVGIADLGLVYTTTVGLEFAMSGVPVIVAGKTHYRSKGFTLDPDSWDEYFEILEKVLADPKAARPSQQVVQDAWHYAYRFFFNYPQAFPWHLLQVWDDVEQWPLSRLLSEEGVRAFGKTFDYLLGQPVDWLSSGIEHE